MSKNKYCILGTGKQGTAALYDILLHGNPSHILLLDSSSQSIDLCLEKIKKIINTDVVVSCKIVDLNNESKIIELLKPYDVFLSAVPYFYNLHLTKIALKSKTSMVDLGGHTENVIKQLDYHLQAIENNISIVPDCGMGPGMNISMALLAMEQLDVPKDVFIWDGGLPKYPKAPWNYSLFFNINGLTNEYDSDAYFLKKGEIVKVKCFEDIESLTFDNVGDLEAAVTCGGLSTMPWTYKGILETLENKTLRYKGHWDTMIAYRQLGLFDQNKVKINNVNISPREFYHHLLEKQLGYSKKDDICIMRTEASGIKNNQRVKFRCEVIEEYDSKTNLMAMEKWTGWHASIVMQMIIKGEIKPGAYPVEKALSGKQFYKEALKRNYNIKIEQI